MATVLWMLHSLLLCVWCFYLPTVIKAVGTLDMYRLQPAGNPEVGDVVQLVCRASDVPVGYTVEWARLVLTGSNEETLAKNGISTNPRFAVSLQSSDATSRAETLVIREVDVQDSGNYYCRLKKSDDTLVIARFSHLAVQLRPTTDTPSTVSVLITTNGESRAPWIASTGVLLLVLILSVIINIYCILKHRKINDGDKTQTPQVEPYLELQPTGAPSREYTGLTTITNCSSAQMTNDMTGQHTYYLPGGEENGGLVYDYPRPDLPNPPNGNSGVVQYRNIDN